MFCFAAHLCSHINVKMRHFVSSKSFQYSDLKWNKIRGDAHGENNRLIPFSANTKVFFLMSIMCAFVSAGLMLEFDLLHEEVTIYDRCMWLHISNGLVSACAPLHRCRLLYKLSLQ